MPQLPRNIEDSQHEFRALAWFNAALKGGGESFVSEQQSRDSDR